MKKLILFLLLFTGYLQAQTLQNPSFGNTTTNTLKIKTPATVTSVNFLSTNEADGTIAKIDPVNLPFINKKTIAEIRAHTGLISIVYTTDIGQEGNWYYDNTDTTSADNTGTILVTADGKRIKRIFVNEASVKWFGAKGDGITDDTAVIQLALSNQSSVYFPKGTYMADAVTGLLPKSNQKIRLDKEATVKCIANNASNYNVFKLSNVNNVTIQGGFIVGDRYTHTGVTGEFGMGIGIFDCTNILIKDIIVSDCWGDGIYIGGNSTASKKITVDNVICDNNRRQGLTITFADGVLVKNSEFKNTNGILPQYGIDIEPNSMQYCYDVEIKNCKTYGNAGGGLQVYGVSGTQRGLVVDNLQSYNNVLGINLIKGTNISILNSNIRNNSAYGVEITKDNVDIFFSNCEIKDNATRGVAIITSGQVTGTEKIYFNKCIIRDNGSLSANTYDGVRIENADNAGFIRNIFFTQCFLGNLNVTPYQRYGVSVEPADASISNIRIDARSLFLNNVTGNYNSVPGVLIIEEYFTTTLLNTFNAKIGGSGTAGYFTKFTASTTIGDGGLNEDANGNLGVNIVAPYNPGSTSRYLTLNGSAGSGVAFHIGGSIASRVAVNATSSNFVETRNLPINFMTNGSTRLSISGSGDVTVNNNLSSASQTITSVPATNSTSYDVLVRNTSNGNVEKIASSSYALDTDVIKTTGNQTKSGYLYVNSTGGFGFIADNTNVNSSDPVIIRKSGKMAFMLNTNGGTQKYAIFDGSTITGTDKTFAFPNQSGNIAVSLDGSATLNFPSTPGQTSSELTITVTGAADGDPVSLGVGNSAAVANGAYSCRVSAANTVTVKFNNYGLLAIDPPSGTFKVKVFK